MLPIRVRGNLPDFQKGGKMSKRSRNSDENPTIRFSISKNPTVEVSSSNLQKKTKKKNNRILCSLLEERDACFFFFQVLSQRTNSPWRSGEDSYKRSFERLNECILVFFFCNVFQCSFQVVRKIMRHLPPPLSCPLSSRYLWSKSWDSHFCRHS